MNIPEKNRSSTRLLGFGAILSGVLVVAPLSAEMVASWTFEENFGVGTQAEIGPIFPEMGIGSFYGFGNEFSVWSDGVGNGSPRSQSVQNIGMNSGYLFEFDPMDFVTPEATILRVSWHQTGTDTSPVFWDPQLSFDGDIYSSVESFYTVTNDNWSSDPGSFRPESVYSLDLLNLSVFYVPTVYFRLIAIDDTAINGGMVTADGISFIDNFTVSVVPEPSTYVLLFGGATLAIVLIRARRRQRV